MTKKKSNNVVVWAFTSLGLILGPIFLDVKSVVDVEVALVVIVNELKNRIIIRWHKFKYSDSWKNAFYKIIKIAIFMRFQLHVLVEWNRIVLYLWSCSVLSSGKYPGRSSLFRHFMWVGLRLRTESSQHFFRAIHCYYHHNSNIKRKLNYII